MNKPVSPVALIVFNRPDTTRRVFDAIAAARPEKLFLIADGPRADRPGEAERCSEVRKIISNVNWPCDVQTNFASENLGCRPRIVSGLNWVFSVVEQAVILEDDCLPDPSFFPFCAELLNRYQDDRRIGFISGFNPLESSFQFPYSYYFSMMTGIWGWATWRRAWIEFDEHIETWPDVKKGGLLKEVLPDGTAVAYWSGIFDSMYAGTGPSAWDYQWVYTCWTRNWLSVLPARNLVKNIGFGPAATHTSSGDPRLMIEARSIEFPLTHPPAITSWPSHVARMQKSFFTPSIWSRICKKIAQRSS